MVRNILSVFALLLALLACAPHQSYAPQEGDLVFQSLPTGDLVEAIEGVSNSPYSHVGLVIRKGDNWYVREAIGPVMDTPLNDWVSRGRNGKAFDAYRLREDLRTHIPALIKETEAFMGRPYDVRYRMDDEAIYCSELVYKAMLKASGIQLGKPQKLGELNWRPYSATIEKYEGGNAPLERQMITPRSQSEAAELEKVFDGYRR